MARRPTCVRSVAPVGRSLFGVAECTVEGGAGNLQYPVDGLHGNCNGGPGTRPLSRSSACRNMSPERPQTSLLYVTT